MKLLHELQVRVQRLLTQPLEELTRAQRSLRYMLDFGRYCARELRADRAGEMAAALTYHTLFSLLPTVVLMLVILGTLAAMHRRLAIGDQPMSRGDRWLVQTPVSLYLG